MSTSAKDTIAGSDTSGGNAGFALKSVFTFTFWVDIAYSASFRWNVPPSIVAAADGAITRSIAPRTAFSSYTLPPSIESPSTSKKVVYRRSNAGVESPVPACTKRKSNSAPRIVVGPVVHSAVTASSPEPDSQYDVRSPNPMQTKPEVVKTACEVVFVIGVTYSTGISSLYSEAGLLTVTRRSKGWPLLKPRFFHRMLPDGKAAPVVSVVSTGIIKSVRTVSKASVHSIATAGLVVEEKSIVTLDFAQDMTNSDVTNSAI